MANAEAFIKINTEQLRKVAAESIRDAAASILRETIAFVEHERDRNAATLDTVLERLRDQLARLEGDSTEETGRA